MSVGESMKLIKTLYFGTVGLIILGAASGVQAQSNLFFNSGFEVGPLAGWTVVSGVSAHVNEAGAADGRNFLELFPGASFWQDVTTVPGRGYIVRFASNPGNHTIRVLLGGTAIGDANFGSSPSAPWVYTNFAGVATAVGEPALEYQ